MADTFPWEDHSKGESTDTSGPWEDYGSNPNNPNKPFQAVAPSGWEAAGRGAIQGATFNFGDELKAFDAATASPEGQLATPLTNAYKYFTGDEPTVKKYNETLEKERGADEAAKSAHPYAYGAGELAGTIPSMAVLPEAGFAARALPTATKIAKFGRTAADAAITGGEYGALSGAGEGTDLNSRGTNALTQGAAGVVGGAAAPVVGEALGTAYNKFGKPVVNTIRGWKDPEGEAARRLAQALRTDQELIASGKAQGMSPADWVAAHAAGEPVTLADLGSTTTQALLRSAANTSPEGRAVLEKVINDRFLGQSDRVADDVRGLVAGGANANKTADQLVAEYDAARVPSYNRAYRDGDRQIMTPEMERLMGSPMVVEAMRRASISGKDRAVTQGLGAFNPGVTIENGVVKFNRGPTGVPTYPNLQFWDATKRELDDIASSAYRAGEKGKGSVATDLTRSLIKELDNEVPSYGAARGVASQFFGESNALEAGRKLAGKQFDPTTIRTVMAKMNPQERELFQEGYASDWANRVIGNIRDTRDITKAMFNSPNERARAQAIFGPAGVAIIQARMTLETIMDGARQAMGNSTTARQLIEAGLAGGVVGGYEGYTHGGIWGGLGGMSAGAIAAKHTGNLIAHGASKLIGYVDANTARNVANLLTSTDQDKVIKGLSVAAKNQKVADGLKSIANRLALAGQNSAQPRIRITPLLQNAQGPGTANANEGRADGGRVKKNTDDLVDEILTKAEEDAAEHAKGGKVQPLPENRASLEAQQNQLVEGNRHAQLFPNGKGELKLPKGMYKAKMENGDIFHYNPKLTNVKKLKAASKAGKENEVLGLGPITKHEAVKRTLNGEHPLAVVERDHKGNELRAAAGTHVTAAAQLAHMARGKSASSTLEIESPMHTLLKRRADGGPVNDDPNDLTNQYNTQLSPQDEAKFQVWAAQNPRLGNTYDYDSRGFWQAGANQADNGHGSDQFKKPNHTTFSTQSQYSGGDNQGGTWTQRPDQSWSFSPSATNLKYNSIPDMQDYVNRDAPNDQFIMPVQPQARGGRIKGYDSGGSPELDTAYDQLNAQNNDTTATDFNQRFNVDQSKPADLHGTDLINSYQDRDKPEEPSILSKVNDTAKRFTNYDREMTGDILNLPKRTYEHWGDVKKALGNISGADQLQYQQKKALGLPAQEPEERYQMWPERMIRSGASLAGDVMSGETPTNAVDPVTGEIHTSSELIQRAQDMAGMAGSGGLGSTEEGAVLNSTPSLRPAMKYQGKIYKSPRRPDGTFGEHAEALPDDVMADYYQRGMTGDDLSDYESGFMNHKGQFMDRASALDYGIENGLVSPDAKKYGVLTSTVLSDSSKPGAALSALEHENPHTTDAYHGTANDFDKFRIGGDDLGVHFGSPTQAEQRLQEVTTNSQPRRIIPVKIDTSNPLTVRDTGRWLPQNVADNLLNTGKFSKQEVTKILDSGKSKEDQLSDFRNLIQDKGYDSIKYLNRHEGLNDIREDHDLIADDPRITDEIFKRYYPEADYSYAAIKPNTVKSKLTGQMLYSDSSEAGAPLAALEHQPFYSQVEQTIQKAPQQKMQGVQWANWLKNQNGVKPDELQYTGIDNWLREQKGLVTKQQVADFIDKNKVQVNDVVKSGKQQLSEDDAFKQAQWEIEEQHPGIDTQSDRYKDEVVYRATQLMQDGRNGGTKYSSYQLPGGENYKEHLITLPSENANKLTAQEMAERYGRIWSDVAPYERQQFEDAAKKEAGKNEYRSSHWDEPNVIAHVRTNERDVQGGYPDNGPKSSHHIEEIQGDWGQAGRKQGFKKPLTEPENKELDALRTKWQSGDHKPGRGTPALSEQESARYEELANKDAANQRAVHDMPFKQTEQWAGLAMKRMIAKAIKSGKDRVSWTPGEAQAARYDLSKHLDRIEYEPNIDDEGKPTGKYDIYAKDKNGKKVFDEEEVNIDRIEQIAGKEIAQKIENNEGSKSKSEHQSPYRNWHALTNLDLKVGGEGMKGFYDKILPSVVQKLGKEYGVKVKEGTVPTYERVDSDNSMQDQLNDIIEEHGGEPTKPKKNTTTKVHYFDIPPKMREDVLKKGFPLFSDSSIGAPINANNKKDQIERPIQKEETAKEVNRAKGGRVVASNINHNPTDKQKETGLYKKDHLHLHGLEISIENAKGSKRKGINADGTRWESILPAHYGYLRRGPLGKDGDKLDVYLGPHKASRKVFVVNQVNPDNKAFDEHKILMCCGSVKQAINLYTKAFSDGKGSDRIGSIVQTDIPSLRKWIDSAKTTLPFKP